MRFTHFPPIVGILLAAGLVSGGYLLGEHNSLGQWVSSGSINSTITIKGTDANIFSDTWDKLHAHFVGKLDDTKLMDGAIAGMVNAAGDPYTVYLDPAAAKDLTEGLQGSFSGIGAEVGAQSGQLVIIAPLPDSPAAKAGLKSQDIIEKIDGATAADMTLDDAVGKIKGTDGTKVTLTITRTGEFESKDFSITRANIQVKSVTSSVRSDNIGYVQISGFHEDTSALLQTALKDMSDKKVRGVILDLRGNPGGLFDSGIDVASMFLKDGVVVKQKDKQGKVESFSTSRAAIMPDTPLAVLVDKGSASASEIVAGALQDYGRAKLIGVTTYGKGSVQELETLANDGELKVTIAQWLTPKDRQISGKGIDPDIKVDKTTDDEKAGRDPQLDRAVQELLKK